MCVTPTGEEGTNGEGCIRLQSKGICMPLLYLLEASYSHIFFLRGEASALA